MESVRPRDDVSFDDTAYRVQYRQIDQRSDIVAILRSAPDIITSTCFVSRSESAVFLSLYLSLSLKRFYVGSAPTAGYIIIYRVYLNSKR